MGLALTPYMVERQREPGEQTFTKSLVLAWHFILIILLTLNNTLGDVLLIQFTDEFNNLHKIAQLVSAGVKILTVVYL